MRGGLRVLRVIGWLLVVGGAARLLVAAATRESANDSGLVPGVALGLMLVAGAMFVFIMEGLIRRRNLGWPVLLLTGASIWLLGGTYLVVWPEPGWPREVPLGLIVAVFAWLGLFFTMYLAIMLLAIYPIMTAIAWLTDQVPYLRRHGVGDAFRAQRRPRV